MQYKYVGMFQVLEGVPSPAHNEKMDPMGSKVL